MISQVFIKCNATSHLKNCENLSIKYIQQSESAMSNLFNCRVQVIVSIVRNVMPQYSMKQDFLRYNIFTSNYVCMNTQKSRVIQRKLHHCQKSILERDELHTSPQSSPKINHMLMHHQSHLHTMKVITILIPSFHSHHLETWDHNRRFVY